MSNRVIGGVECVGRDTLWIFALVGALPHSTETDRPGSHCGGGGGRDDEDEECQLDRLHADNLVKRKPKLVGRPEGKRPFGRPRRRWEDNIKMDLREVGYDGRDWVNLAQDRDQWRAYNSDVACHNFRVFLSDHKLTSQSVINTGGWQSKRNACGVDCRIDPPPSTSYLHRVQGRGMIGFTSRAG
ncbi:hypothetical protein ANN_18614 [Periplaneta americana]|uniref:Uncharacterized protein n=1 Tax=Periplaneta americana TaxID=6978 RepID=A0ABQ8SRC0_PERAM|nr:hypothetical protein ANN_18614 [Periplaneta americana]